MAHFENYDLKIALLWVLSRPACICCWGSTSKRGQEMESTAAAVAAPVVGMAAGSSGATGQTRCRGGNQSARRPNGASRRSRTWVTCSQSRCERGAPAHGIDIGGNEVTPNCWPTCALLTWADRAERLELLAVHPQRHVVRLHAAVLVVACPPLGVAVPEVPAAHRAEPPFADRAGLHPRGLHAPRQDATHDGRRQRPLLALPGQLRGDPRLARPRHVAATSGTRPASSIVHCGPAWRSGRLLRGTTPDTPPSFRRRRHS